MGERDLFRLTVSRILVGLILLPPSRGVKRMG